MSNEQNYWNQKYANAVDESIILHKPSSIYKPALFIDGDKWCALYGLNIQYGVTGFGDTPEKAIVDFDYNFKNQKAR